MNEYYITRQQSSLLYRCVMKMDHHCPWINNCCGHLNHAYFTSFLLLAPLGCSHAAMIFIMTMYTQLYDRVILPSPPCFSFSGGLNHLRSFACFLTADIIWLEHRKDQHECRSSVSAPHTLQRACLCCYTLCLRSGTGHHYCRWHAFLHTGTFFKVFIILKYTKGITYWTGCTTYKTWDI